MEGPSKFELTVVSWNVLAAPWAAPQFYPAQMEIGLLDRSARADRVGSLLASLAADAVCLQETTPLDLARLLEGGLGRQFDVHAAPNGRELWSHWSSAAVPWEPNGTAILWRRGAFADVKTGDVTLSDDGNVATTLTARHATSGVTIRIMSVHLDADLPELRRKQLPIALATADAPDAAIDIVAGDCNEDTVGTDLGAVIAQFGFRDALSELGNADPTHPYARPSDAFAAVGRLDHVLVRGARPTDGTVVDSDVWSIEGAAERLAEHLARTGSDHLPVVVTLG